MLRSPRRRRVPRLLVALGLVVVAIAAPRGRAGAQEPGAQALVVTGVVVDTTGTPLAGVELSLPGSAARAVTGNDGRFRLPGLPRGSMVLRARRIGYGLTTVPLTIGTTPPPDLRITLRAVPLELSPVVIEARADGFARDLRGFYERRSRGIGRFLTREDMLHTQAQRMTDALRALVPGVTITSRNTFVKSIRLRGNRCPPLVWIDGTPAPAAEFDVDVVLPETISGVEVYSGPSTVPIEFRMARGLDACGVIAIWSRNDLVDAAVVREREEQQRRRDAAHVDTGRVYHADEVDEPAKPLDDELAEPVYPDSLLAYHVTGKVVAEFVVEVSGLVNPRTIQMVSTSHPKFFDAVREALIVSKFAPATLDGKPVRQAVLMPFEFGGEAKTRDAGGGT